MDAEEPKEGAPGPPAEAPRDAGISKNIERALALQLPVIVILAERKMELKDVLNLTPGQVVEFDKSAEDRLEVRVNNRRIALGEAVKIDQRFGLRITNVGGPRETLDILRGKAAS
jgi:flagellar motor switch protein FliN/FliY